MIAQDDRAGNQPGNDDRQDEAGQHDRDEVAGLRVDPEHADVEDGSDRVEHQTAGDGGQRQRSVIGEDPVPRGFAELSGFDGRDHRDDRTRRRTTEGHRGDDEWQVEREDAVTVQALDAGPAEQADGDPEDESEEDPFATSARGERDLRGHREAQGDPGEGDRPGDDLDTGVGEEGWTMVGSASSVHRATRRPLRPDFRVRPHAGTETGSIRGHSHGSDVPAGDRWPVWTSAAVRSCPSMT